jgi:hypothetical protein
MAAKLLIISAKSPNLFILGTLIFSLILVIIKSAIFLLSLYRAAILVCSTRTRVLDITIYLIYFLSY